MFFNSIDFAIFLTVVFIIHWFLLSKNLKAQNFWLLVSSYFFYAYWDYRFLFLLIFSTLLDFYTGIKIAEVNTKSLKKFWFWVSITINIGFLGIFKYYNFFADSFADLLSQFGFQTNVWSLKVILPVGISFYTFHGLSYIIDIYNNRIKPERNFINYSLFVSFFPLLVAGPIERATHLLPQVKQRRIFNYSKAVDGLRQILWGLFKKVVIADQCSLLVDPIFNGPKIYSGSTHLEGAIYFAFQIYCDFSGYSDIALGVARLFGFELLRNFAFPYFSRNIAEFWRRWHISLSSWFKDYLYIPLGGSKGGTLMKVRNTFAIFVVSGFWHGANWTFIIWGFLNALYILPSILFDSNRHYLNIVAAGKVFPSIKETLSIITTFCLTVFAWIFFRSENISHALSYISSIFSNSLFTIPEVKPPVLFLLVMMFIIIEWHGREQQYAIAKLALKWPKAIRLSVYYILVLSICYYSNSKQQFIYFQF